MLQRDGALGQLAEGHCSQFGLSYPEKPQVGARERPIAVATLHYAVWAKARKQHAADYDRRNAAWWDVAVAGPGGGALRAALRRRLFEQVAIENKADVVTAPIDIASFVDEIDVKTCVKSSLRGALILRLFP